MNEVERQVMEFALRGEHPALAILRAQLAAATVSARDYTGVGFFTHFAVPAGVPRLPSLERLVIGDVYADVSGLQHEAGFLIFVERGVLDVLECFIVEDAWPDQAQIRCLYYMHPKKLGSPMLVKATQRDLGFALGGLCELRDFALKADDVAPPPKPAPPAAG